MLKGQCLCGAIKYETNGSPYSATCCHCSLCRKASGASPVAWFTVPMASFRFVAGTPRQYHSSAKGTRSFCGDCGTQLTFQSRELPNEIDITTCSLDVPALVPPRSHIHVASRVTWTSSLEGLPTYDEQAMP